MTRFSRPPTSDLAAAIIAYVTGLRSARRRPLRRSEICAWFSAADPADVNATLDRLLAEGRLRLVKAPDGDGIRGPAAG